MRLVSLSAVIVLAGLGACTSALESMTVPNVGECPQATILAEAVDATVFNSATGRDLPDIQYQAHLSDLESTCDYGRTRGVRMAYTRLNFNVSIDLGSAAMSRPIDVPYFVAVIVPETQTVLTREIFTVRAAFDGNTRSVIIPDHIGSIAIPVSEGADGGAYEVVIGFQLTPEQVEFNRASRH